MKGWARESSVQHVRVKKTVGRAILSAALAVATLSGRSALAEPIPPGWQAQNVQPIGFSSLQGRFGAFKLSIKQANGRWYLYMGHSFDSGWSILDVTDPKDPKYVKFIPGPKGVLTSQVTLAGNIMMTALAGGPGNETGAAVLIWDISDPTNPKKISEWKGGQSGSHRNSYPGGRYAYMATSMPGYRGNIFVILDVADPAHPTEAGRYWTPGQKDGEAPSTSYPSSFHGPASISPDGKLATMPYTPSIVNLDISDVAHPKLLGALQMTPPFAKVGGQSVHTVLPLWDRQLLFASSEAMASECKDDGMHFAALIDNKDPAKPRLLSMFPVPRPPAGAPYKDFCAKGGRFGPHNVNQQIHLPEVEKPGNLFYIAYFNAGLRIFDISNPQLPTETGWFVPPERPDAPGGQSGPHASPVNWTEEVLVDTRGNIYICDDKWGVFVLRYTGAGQPRPTAQ
jgi:hypothetical protein